MLCDMIAHIRERFLAHKERRNITFRVIAEECNISHETLRKLAANVEPGHAATWQKLEAWVVAQEKECDNEPTRIAL